MTRRQGPTKRLLIVPVLLLTGVLVAVHLVQAASVRVADPFMAVDAGAAAGDVRACSRAGARADLEQAREAIVSQLATNRRVTSAMVLACPSGFDELSVTYVGELIGDLLERDGGAWVLVNDDDYALVHGPLPAHRRFGGTNSGLTVWLPDDLLPRVTGLGRPNQRGDVVELEGEIRRTDPEDGGGLTLRADTLTVLAPSSSVSEPLDVPQAVFAGAAVLIGAALWILRRATGRR